MPVGTALRNIRIDDELWQRLRDAAKRSNMTLSGFVREVLTEALDDHAMRESLVKATRPRTEVVPTSPIRTPVVGKAVLRGDAGPLETDGRRVTTPVGERRPIAHVKNESDRPVNSDELQQRCPRHPKAIVRDGECQTCRLEANRG